MKFKIGDRVRFKPAYMEDGFKSGTVVEVGGSCYPSEWSAVEFEGGEAGEYMNWALELVPATIAPRGPRPLPIRQRVTLTAGKTLRQPPRAVWTQVHSLHSPRTSDGVRPWFV